METEKIGLGVSFNGTALPDSSNFSEDFSYITRVIEKILEGEKPLLIPSRDVDARIISILQVMEKQALLHENWEQFVLLPDQNPEGKMAKGVTSIDVMCAPLNENGIYWQKRLKDAAIANCVILGFDLGLRVDRGQVDIHEVAQSFILPEGDLESLHQFLKVLTFNLYHPSSARAIAIDNRRGFWNDLKNLAPDDVWSRLEVIFAKTDDEVIQFIKDNVSPENVLAPPLKIDHPFQFLDKNPVLILGTGNPKKIADTRAILQEKAPLLKMVDFLSTIGPFVEPLEKSITCVGNALEKMEAMLNEIYSDDGTLSPKISQKYEGRPIILIANDTAALIKLIDENGVEVTVDFLERPELRKSKDFIAQGKGRWWPGAEVKMVSSAEGKSITFYKEKLPDLVKNVSAEVGKLLHIEYTDISVYLYAVLSANRKDIKYFATKGSHLDEMVFECDPEVGEADYETFTVPLKGNPDRKTRAQLGVSALLKESATLEGLDVFLQRVNFPEGLNLQHHFNVVKRRRIHAGKNGMNKPAVGTLSAFDKNSSSFGFHDFKQTIANAGFRVGSQKYDFSDLGGFETYLASVDALLLGGNEGLDLTPLKRAALISRIFVAIQTSHASFAGKPLTFVRQDMDPVCEWFLRTQEFLYNHKLYGRRAQDSFMVAYTLQGALRASGNALASYEPPVVNIPNAFYHGNDVFDRPTVSILGSASTYDPQHISIGHRFAVGCAERDLHFRHGGCSRGVVGGAADAFAAYRDKHAKGRMTGVQCHGLVNLEGMNEGNDCSKIHKTIGERKLDIYKSDIHVFASGGWGTFEELFDMLALIEAEKIRPDRIIILDYAFDSSPDESTYQPIREFFNTFLTPQQIQAMNIYFVKDDKEALAMMDERLPYLLEKYQKPVLPPNSVLKIA